VAAVVGASVAAVVGASVGAVVAGADVAGATVAVAFAPHADSTMTAMTSTERIVKLFFIFFSILGVRCAGFWKIRRGYT
jgi:hypothetical protein